MTKFHENVSILHFLTKYHENVSILHFLTKMTKVPLKHGQEMTALTPPPDTTTGHHNWTPLGTPKTAPFGFMTLRLYPKEAWWTVPGVLLSACSHAGTGVVGCGYPGDGVWGDMVRTLVATRGTGPGCLSPLYPHCFPHCGLSGTQSWPQWDPVWPHFASFWPCFGLILVTFRPLFR